MDKSAHSILRNSSETGMSQKCLKPLTYLPDYGSEGLERGLSIEKSHVT